MVNTLVKGKGHDQFMWLLKLIQDFAIWIMCQKMRKWTLSHVQAMKTQISLNHYAVW